MSKEPPSSFLTRGAAEALGRASTARQVAQKGSSRVRVQMSRERPEGTFEAVRGAWAVSGTWTMREQRPVIASLHFDLKARTLPRNGLPPSLLKVSLLDEVLLQVRNHAQAVALEDDAHAHFFKGKRQLPESTATALPRPRSRGRPRTDDQILHRVAELFLYFQSLRPRPVGGVYEAIVRTMEGELSRRPIPSNTVRTWLKRAQEAGYITSGSSGHRDRFPGPNFDRSRAKGTPK